MAVTPATAARVVAGARFARTPLAVLPTPLVAAPRLAEALGTGPLLVKRDDLTGFAFGGNKARLLEFLLAAATAEGADTFLAGGAAGLELLRRGRRRGMPGRAPLRTGDRRSGWAARPRSGPCPVLGGHRALDRRG